MNAIRNPIFEWITHDSPFVPGIWNVLRQSLGKATALCMQKVFKLWILVSLSLSWRLQGLPVQQSRQTDPVAEVQIVVFCVSKMSAGRTRTRIDDIVVEQILFPTKMQFVVSSRLNLSQEQAFVGLHGPINIDTASPSTAWPLRPPPPQGIIIMQLSE